MPITAKKKTCFFFFSLPCAFSFVFHERERVKRLKVNAVFFFFFAFYTLVLRYVLYKRYKKRSTHRRLRHAKAHGTALHVSASMSRWRKKVTIKKKKKDGKQSCRVLLLSSNREVPPNIFLLLLLAYGRSL